MESKLKKLGFEGSKKLKKAPPSYSIKGVVSFLNEIANANGHRLAISLGMGDPSCFKCFRTATIAEDAVVEALRSAKFNFYAPIGGIPPARKLFDLLPERGWEVDLDAIEAIADENTIAIVIINPGNPCGSVYSYERLIKIAETARKLGIIVVSDELYGHVVFGSKPFVPMGVFGSTVPVITLGSISKRWMVPGWRLGWLVISDPTGLLKKCGISDSIINVLNPTPFSPTFIQAAVPKILEKTTEDFYTKTIDILREASDFCYDKLKEIPCITCSQKAEGAMFVMLNFSLLEDTEDDMEFCLKLAKEESLLILPGEHQAEPSNSYRWAIAGKSILLNNRRIYHPSHVCDEIKPSKDAQAAKE
ncbi:unnamed protein product [Dovyalis caffra]|uniref:Aminotransferase class I/classII large domain-containing protein n=1 Tax=Dovyalis caffra TaxID=77055 RepID=A0AAV1QQT1_9ROSI|nr:unnamed protein product [Dovyalis caffra]